MSDYLSREVKCPYCGEITTEGELISISGRYGCPNCYFVEGGLRDVTLYLQENFYEDYVSMEYYKEGYLSNKVKYLSERRKELVNNER